MDGDQARNRRTLRVLVVEDDATTADVVTMFLRAEGYEVRCAADGVTAVTLAEESFPDVALLDFNLGEGMDGCDVAGRLRTMPGADRVMILVVSGTDPAEFRDKADGAGVNLIVRKPCQPEFLAEILKRFDGSRAPWTEPSVPV